MQLVRTFRNAYYLTSLSARYTKSLELTLRQIEEHPLVSFLPLDLTSEDSLETVVSHVDYVMQYGEDEEPKEVRILSSVRSSVITGESLTSNT